MAKNKKILIADDSEFMRKILKDILKSAGYTNFIEAGDGEETLKKQASEKPDLILLDIIMPETDGMQVLKKIGRRANILIISAIGQEKTIEEAKMLGAKGFVIKPFDRKKVIDEIEKAMA